VAYRLHVGTFTGEADDVDDVSRGTFLGVLKKVPHLRRLGGRLYSELVTGMRSCLFCLSFLPICLLHCTFSCNRN
jgi:hypothetical protein